MHNRIHAVLFCLIVFAPLNAAFATSSLMNLARQRYPRIAGTRLDSCSLCHTSGSSLDSYGQAYRSSGRNFASIEAQDSDGDGFSNLAELNALTFPGDRNDFSKTNLYFPSATNTASRFTGFAITNTSSVSATVVLSAYQSSGQAVAAGTAVSGYKILEMPAHSQIANLAYELFGSGLQLDGGWVRLASPQAGVTGFSLSFDDRLSSLDGTSSSPLTLGSMILPELRGAEFALVNPSETQPVTADLIPFDDQGRQQNPVSVQIPASGRFSARVETLFPSLHPDFSGYLKISASAGIVAEEFISSSGAEVSALSGIDASGGGLLLYSPQFAAGGGTWRSALTLVNLEDSPTNLTLSFVSNNGLQLGRSLAIDVAGRARLVIPDPSAFDLPAVPDELLEGFVRITSSVTRVAGSVTFGDPADTRFRTSLPCVAQGNSDLIFSQVAQNETWFTGLAAVNANSVPADVTISVFRTDGSSAGTGTIRVEPNSRFSKVLTELVPGLPLLDKGYFTVRSSQPLFSFAVFGTQSLSVLSAIPPQ